MFQAKISASVRVPVRLLDSAGAPVTGKVAADVTATVYYSDGTSASPTVTGNWNETAAGAYQLTLTPSVLGPVQVVIVVSGANDFVGVFDCVTDFASDAVTAANAATTAASAASTSATGAVTAAGLAQTAAEAALAALTGGWTLDPTLNQLTLFAADNTTVIAKFNLFNSAGVPSVDPVFQRVRI